jgi:hypothetical protein
MAEVPPSPNDDSDSDEFREAVKRTQWLSLYWKLAEKHFNPPVDSVVDLAARLKVWQEVESSGPIPNERSPFEKIVDSVHSQIAQGIKDRVIEACLKPDGDEEFLRRLSEAKALAAKGKISQSLDTIGAALYTIGQLREELGHLPNRQQVQERVEQWRKEGGLEAKVSPRQWERVWKEIGSLLTFPPVKSAFDRR